MVVGGLVILAARRLKAEVEARHAGVPFHEAFRDDAAEHGATRIDQKFEPYPGVEFDDATYLGDAYPGLRLGRRGGERRGRPRHRRGRGPRRHRGRRRRAR